MNTIHPRNPGGKPGGESDGPDRPPPRSAWTRRTSDGDDVTEFVPARFYPNPEALLADHRRHRDVLNAEQAERLTAWEKDMASLVEDFGPNAEGLAAALDLLGWEARFCHRSKQVWWRHTAEGGRWENGTKRFTSWMRHVLRRDAGLKFSVRGDQTWSVAFDGMLHHVGEIDMFTEWLDTLPAWDGHPRIDGWLEATFETDPGDELAAWAARFVFLGAVERAYYPGSKLDEIPVLSGPQGCGKSTALRHVLPPGRWGDLWFCDGLDLSADDKRRAESLQGRVIVEVSEMVGSSRAELQSLKAFISRTDDGSVRLAFRPDPEPMPRRAILVGTCNPGEVLPNDASGLRRFVMVKLHGGSVGFLRDYLAANRSQMWAEALALHAQGATARLPDHLHAQAAERNENYRRRDAVLEDALAEWAATYIHPHATLTRIAEAIGLVHSLDSTTKISQRDQARLTAALRSMGWEDARIYDDGRRIRVWIRPQSDGTAWDTTSPIDARAAQLDF